MYYKNESNETSRKSIHFITLLTLNLNLYTTVLELYSITTQSIVITEVLYFIIRYGVYYIRDFLLEL